MAYSTADGSEPRFVVSDGRSHLEKDLIEDNFDHLFWRILIYLVQENCHLNRKMVVLFMFVFPSPHDVLNPLRDEDEEEEEEEVGGGVADELQERLPHRLQRNNQQEDQDHEGYD